MINLHFSSVTSSKLVFKDTLEEQKNTFIQKGYSLEEIEIMYESLSSRTILKLLTLEYIDLKKFYSIPNFQIENLDRYNAYQTLTGESMKESVTKVNLNLDKPFYSEIEIIQNGNDPLILINKYRALPEDYIPEDLIEIPSYPSLLLRSIATDSFENLLAAAKLDNIFLIPYSTYRSYEYQKNIHQKYLEKETEDIVDSYSARAGHSEHQTGLAIDIRSHNHWNNVTDADYEWLKKNAYKYGFIIRYPKESSNVTGYKEEPWHIRYIGVEHATKIQELNITYDEYYDIFLTEH